MATKSFRQGVKRRIGILIAEAGSEMSFAKRVWPRESPDCNKSKVNKWRHGHSGISPEEAAKVAIAFGRRPAWLMFGELPERPGVARSDADLATDVAARVAQAIIERSDGEGWRDHVILEPPQAAAGRAEAESQTGMSRGTTFARYTIDGRLVLEKIVEQQLDLLRAEWARAESVAERMKQDLLGPGSRMNSVTMYSAMSAPADAQSLEMKRTFLTELITERMESEIETWLDGEQSVFRPTSSAVLKMLSIPARHMLDTSEARPSPTKRRKR